MQVPAMADADVRIDPQFMFSNHKNVHKPRFEKAQRKLLKKIPFINAFLGRDEKVLLVVPCVSPTSIMEQLTTGWIFTYLNRALLVVTNKGIFHVLTRSNYQYRQSIAEFRYDACKELRISWGQLKVRYGDGKKEGFLYIPRAQRKKLKSYFASLRLRPEAAGNTGRRHLCPRCTTPLVPNVYQCSSCRLAFKDMSTANKLSILIPGGGYFYTGHWFLGIGDFLVEFLLLTVIIAGGVVLMQPESENDPGVFIFTCVIFVLEKLITIHHAKRYILEYLPKEPVARTQPELADSRP